MLKRILVAVVGVPIIVYLTVIGAPFCTLLFVELVVIIACWEFMRAVAPEGDVRIKLLTLVSSAAIPAAVFYENGSPLMHYIICGTEILFISCIFVCAMLRYEKGESVPMSEFFASVFSGIIIPYFFSTIISMRLRPNGNFFVMLPFIISMVSDGGAYFVGKSIGKRKAFPKVSPNKTVEGCVGGLVSGVLATVVFGLILAAVTKDSVNYTGLVICAVVGNLATQLGDLTFSYIKRICGVKDFGRLLPGHGGMLDRFDSMIFSSPVIFLTALLLHTF